MSSAASGDLLQVDEVQGVTVVRFTRRTILDPEAIEAVGHRLLGLVREQGCRRLALDFARVESLTSAMLGHLVGLYRAVEAEQGRLAFCNVDLFLRQIFTICNLPPQIPVHADEASAVRLLAGEGTS